MTTLEIEIALMKHFDIRRNLIVPGVTNLSFLVRFETDLLILSNSYFATGIEIKVSKADLKKDLKKSHIKNLYGKFIMGKTPIQFYYKTLKNFYYAVPEFLKDEALKQIPDFAGLIIIEKFEKRNIVKVIRAAKKLNHYKWSDKERLDLSRLGTMRILNLKEKIKQLQ